MIHTLFQKSIAEEEEVKTVNHDVSLTDVRFQVKAKISA